jgi:8-hydroxy-5-deazaflavin:NADPH oxidoreductase
VKYAILGAGNVGTSIARAVTAAGHDVTAADPDRSTLDSLAGQIADAATTADPAEAVADADVVVLAVPFHVVEDLVSGLADALARS